MPQWALNIGLLDELVLFLGEHCLQREGTGINAEQF